MIKYKLVHKNPKLFVKSTRLYGHGVFAGEDIKKGVKIKNLSGKKICVDDLIKKLKKGEEKIDDPLQVGKKSYIDLDPLSRTFNHSCSPNAGLRKKNELVALRNIKKEEEITYDYSATIAPTLWKMRCNCRSKKCRKIIGDVSTIPPKVLRRYEKIGVLQNYMKSLLKSSIKNGKLKFTLPIYEINVLNKLGKNFK